MDDDVSKEFIRRRAYKDAAVYLKNYILKNKKISTNTRNRLTNTSIIAIKALIKNKHIELKEWYGNALKPMDIVEKVFNEVVDKLAPPVVDIHKTLSEIENEEQFR